MPLLPCLSSGNADVSCVWKQGSARPCQQARFLYGDTGNSCKQVSETKKTKERSSGNYHAFLKEIDHSFCIPQRWSMGLCFKDCAHCKDLEKHHGLYGLVAADLPTYNTLIHCALYACYSFLEMDHFKLIILLKAVWLIHICTFGMTSLLRMDWLETIFALEVLSFMACEKLHLFIGSHYNGWYIMSNSCIQSCNFSLEATMVHISWRIASFQIWKHDD